MREIWQTNPLEKKIIFNKNQIIYQTTLYACGQSNFLISKYHLITSNYVKK